MTPIWTYNIGCLVMLAFFAVPMVRTIIQDNRRNRPNRPNRSNRSN